MHATIIADLRVAPDWDPARLAAEAFRWPADCATATLGESFVRVMPESFADIGNPVITPASLDGISGGVRRRTQEYQGVAYQVGLELRFGDLLVPRNPDGIVLLVEDDLMGALISSSFTAIRPRQIDMAWWVWAHLNSDPGRDLREVRAEHASTSRLLPSALMDLALPVMSPESDAAVLRKLREIAKTAQIEEEDGAPATWWSTADLRGHEWRLMMSPCPEQLRQGTPLGDLCTMIVRGRSVVKLAVDNGQVGFLPVTDIGVLGGKPPRRWIAPDDDHLRRAEPGDICVAGPGSRAYATIISAPCVVDGNVYLCRLRDQRQADIVVRFLNGRRGFDIRRALMTGWNLNKSDLQRFPIPDEVLDSTVTISALAPLAERLEDALWPQ